jgi:predicted nucleic acid-binding protein
MKSIFFDAGPVISLSTNNLLWLLPELKKGFGGKFYISARVKSELIDVPYRSKKFKFEALQVMKSVEEKTFEIVPVEVTSELTRELLFLANNSFFARDSPMRLVHEGEIDSIAGAVLMKSEAVVIDERTTRLMVEDWRALKDLLQSKLHTKIRVDAGNLNRFIEKIKGVKIIRSAELVVLAYEKGMLNSYLPKVKDAEKELIDGVLWGIKLNGCSISREEIEKIVRIES